MHENHAVSRLCTAPGSGLRYLEEEWALVLGLRAGRPEPVRKGSGLGCGDEVAQSHGLLQDVEGLLMGLHAVRVMALQ